MDERIDRRVLIALGAVAVLVIGLIVFAAVRGGDEQPQSRPTVTVTQTVGQSGTDETPRPVVSGHRRSLSTKYTPTPWPTTPPPRVTGRPLPYNGPPLNLSRAQAVVAGFAVPFSTFDITGGAATKSPARENAWVAGFRGFLTPSLAKEIPGKFTEYWWYLTSDGKGAKAARVMSVAKLYALPGTVTLRVVVERQVVSRSDPLGHPENVSWDVSLVAGSTAEDPPLVSSVVRSPPGPVQTPQVGPSPSPDG